VRRACDRPAGGVAYDDKVTMDRLEQSMGFGQYREDPVEMLTLSACETAAVDDRAAHGRPVSPSKRGHAAPWPPYGSSTIRPPPS